MCVLGEKSVCHFFVSFAAADNRCFWMSFRTTRRVLESDYVFRLQKILVFGPNLLFPFINALGRMH